MKKLFAIMVMMCVCLPFCGFKSVSSGAIISTTGQVSEVVTIRYSAEDAQMLQITLDEFNNAVNRIASSLALNSIQATLQGKYENKINNSTTLTVDEKQNLLSQFEIVTAQKNADGDGQFVLNITYETKSAWNWFCSDVISKAVETTETNLFVKNYVTKMPIKISTVTDNSQEISLIDYTFRLFTVKLSNELGKDISSILTSDYSYIYATNTARLHTDANQVQYDITSGLTYYLWEYDTGDNNPQMTLWQTRANAVTWYCFALILTGAFGVVLLFVAKNKKQKTFDKE